MDKRKKGFLTVKEVAQWFCVKPVTIYRKARTGELPAIKFGKSWLFSENLLEEWVSKRGAMPIVEAEIFSSVRPVVLVYLFGSFAEGGETPLSDIDIAYLDDDSASPFDFEPELEACVRKLFSGAKRVDLIRLNKAPSSVKYKVIKSGTLLYARDTKAQAVFEEETSLQYLDFEPVLRRFYKEAA